MRWPSAAAGSEIINFGPKLKSNSWKLALIKCICARPSLERCFQLCEFLHKNAVEACIEIEIASRNRDRAVLCPLMRAAFPYRLVNLHKFSACIHSGCAILLYLKSLSSRSSIEEELGDGDALELVTLSAAFCRACTSPKREVEVGL